MDIFGYFFLTAKSGLLVAADGDSLGGHRAALPRRKQRSVAMVSQESWEKKAEVTLVISDTVDFRASKTIRDREGRP